LVARREPMAVGSTITAILFGVPVARLSAAFAFGGNFSGHSFLLCQANFDSHSPFQLIVKQIGAERLRQSADLYQSNQCGVTVRFSRDVFVNLRENIA
jgi:hypothetical protein